MSAIRTRSSYVFHIDSGKILCQAITSKAPRIQQIYVPSTLPNKSVPSCHALYSPPSIQLQIHRKIRKDDEEKKEVMGHAVTQEDSDERMSGKKRKANDDDDSE